MSDRRRISEARGLVQRLCSVLTREEQESRSDLEANRPGPSSASGSGSSVPVSASALETHRLVFGYQPSGRKRALSQKKHYPKKAKMKQIPWSHMFVCLSETESCSVPCDYALLTANGLGKKKLQLSEQSTAKEIHDSIIEAFPKLINAGGYELLRTVESSKRLIVITPPLEGYTGMFFLAKLNVSYDQFNQ